MIALGNATPPALTAGATDGNTKVGNPSAVLATGASKSGCGIAAGIAMINPINCLMYFNWFDQFYLLCI